MEEKEIPDGFCKICRRLYKRTSVYQPKSRCSNCCHTEHYISKYGEAIYTDEKPKIKATALKSTRATNSGEYFARQFIGKKVKI